MFWTIVTAILAAQAILYVIGLAIIGIGALMARAGDWIDRFRPLPPAPPTEAEKEIDNRRREWVTNAGWAMFAAFFVATFVYVAAVGFYTGRGHPFLSILIAAGMAAIVALQRKGARARAGL